MIIWAGWGIIGALLALAGGGAGAALATGLGLSAGVGMGLGVILGSVAAWFAGRYFNVTRPAELEGRLLAERHQELQHLVQSGQFHMGPGYAPPRSHAEAQAQADQLMASEAAALRGRAGNKHTLFFIPMQYAAIVTGIIGAVVMGVSLAG